MSFVRHPTLFTFAITLAVVSGFILLPLSICQADTYQWVDKNGVINFADNLQKVPPEYRDSAKKIDGGRGKTMPRASQPAPSAPSSVPNIAPNLGMNTDMTNQMWRDRLRDARTDLENLKAEREKALKEYETFVAEYRMRTFGDPAAEAKHRARLADLGEQITQKEEEINTTIPEEARRAGVPGGALNR
jgi:hypothetical protein